MSAIVVALISLAVLTLGYFLYSPLVARWLGIEYDKPTPAVEMNDGEDYVPAKHWTILFGHHFASIAGAAPILGPVLACLYWGWLPAVIWLVVGGVFFGAVHDFTSLVLSVRHKGESITSLTEEALGKTTKIIFSLFVFLTLILVVAVFAAAAGKTLANTPEVVIPTFGLVLVAMLVGYLMYHLHINIFVCSLAGLGLLMGLIILGYNYPVSIGDLQFVATVGSTTRVLTVTAVQFWTVVLLIYGLIASVTPVTILLQPRDHLAAGVLFVGMLLGFAGILTSNPSMKTPPFVTDFSPKGGHLWPMLFVTVACGAVSGFHSLVASGTTSKQLASMRHARRIGYGGMIVESALSILAVLAVASGLYWSKEGIPAGTDGLVYSEVMKNQGWIAAFGSGYGTLTKRILSFLGDAAVPIGALIGITMLKTFVMTTLDSATRITRYMANDLFGDTFKIKPMKNKYVATIFVGVLSGSLALGNWQAIWPVFGASNQLIASLVFIVASVYLISRKRNWLFTAIPAVLMLITTLAALTVNICTFLTAEKPKYLLTTVAAILIVLAVAILLRSVNAIMNAGKRPLPNNTAHETNETELVNPHV